MDNPNETNSREWWVWNQHADLKLSKYWKLKIKKIPNNDEELAQIKTKTSMPGPRQTIDINSGCIHFLDFFTVKILHSIATLTFKGLNFIK